MGSAGEADWREELFQKIKPLKDACFSELMEFYQTVNVPKITKEHFYSLPREKADRIKNIAKLKDAIRNMLNFLQLPKRSIPEGLKGQFPKYQTLVRNLVDLHRKKKYQNADMSTGRQVRGGAETPVDKKPIGRLVAAVLSSSPAALRSSANSIWSVLSLSDCVPHGEVGTFQHWTFLQQRGGSNTLNKMKRVFDHTTSRSGSPPLGSMDGVTMNANDLLLEEIKAVNRTLIDTAISITGDDGTDGICSCSGGTTIELLYTAVSLAPSLKPLSATSEMSIVMPAKLFVPSDYPISSPVLLNYRGEDQLRNLTDLSEEVAVAFRRALGDLPEPWSIKGTARAWDACVRTAVTELAHRLGGGTSSSRLGRWESCVGA